MSLTENVKNFFLKTADKIQFFRNNYYEITNQVSGRGGLAKEKSQECTNTFYSCIPDKKRGSKSQIRNRTMNI